MSKKSDGKGLNLGWILLIGLIVGAGVIGASQLSSTTSFESETATSTTEFVTEEVTDPYEDIRNRAEIQRQQELIVMETYLSEERIRIEGEKEAAIADFDSQLAEVEAKLEEVRGEKVSFQ
jgi:hypothetical protein